MQNKPLVSVIVNCYNGEKYINEAISSVFEQTYQHWELLVWDNRSTDNTAAICASFTDLRFRYILAPKHTNLGMARKEAVKEAAGTWVCFLDCDDLWHPKKLEHQLEYIEALPDINIIYCQTKYLFEGSLESSWAKNLHKSSARDENLKPKNIGFNSLLYKNYIPLVSALFYKESYDSVGGIDASLSQAEDYDLILKLAKIGSVYLVNETLCYYRIHGHNVTQSQLQLDHQECIKILNKFLPDAAVSKAIYSRNAKFALNLLRAGKVREAFGYSSITRMASALFYYISGLIVR